jgi:hypothetical protein
MQYGRWIVTKDRNAGISGSKTMYGVEREGENERVEINTGKTGKKLARTLAAALDKAGAIGSEELLPPSLGPSSYDGDPWEAWAADTDAVPVKVAAAGKASIAAWLKVVHQEREKWIAGKLGVSESTVRQYLSDLREGRR